jgi:hypothetical protein
MHFCLGSSAEGSSAEGSSAMLRNAKNCLRSVDLYSFVVEFVWICYGLVIVLLVCSGFVMHLLRIRMDLLWVCIGFAIDLYDIQCICCGFATALYD